MSHRSKKIALVVGLTAAGTAVLLARTRAGTRAARFALPRLSDRAWTLPLLPIADGPSVGAEARRPRSRSRCNPATS